MTVELTGARKAFTGTGVSSSYASAIYAKSASQIIVTVNGVVVSSYSLSGLGSSGGVTVIGTFTAGAEVIVRRKTPQLQQTQTVNNETILEDVLDDALDKSMMIDQELQTSIEGTLRLPFGETLAEFPKATGRISRFMQWASDGLSLEFLSTSALASTLAVALAPLLPGVYKGDPGANVMAIGLFTIASLLNIPVGTDLVQTSGYSVAGKGFANYAYDAAVNAAYVVANPYTSFVSANGRGFKFAGHEISPLQAGAAGDDIADDKLPTAAAFATGKPVVVPNGYTFRITGGIVMPDKAKLYGRGGIINFDAPVTNTWLFALGADAAPLDVSDIHIIGVHFRSTADKGFMHIIRLSNQGTIDRFYFNNNIIEYPVVPGNSQDRWVIAGGNSGGTRTNFQINFNHVTGPMQLLASGIGGHTIKHWNILCNNLKNTRANAIAVVSLGTLGPANTGEDIMIGWNDIYADTYTAVGIFLGIDQTSTDRNVIMRRIKVIGNRINIVAAGAGQSDVVLRIGNKCASIGGFDSVADEITFEGNHFYGGIQLTQEPPATASGTSLLTKFLMKGNYFYGGDILLRYLGDGAKLEQNTAYAGAAVRMGEGNGRVHSNDNTWSIFTPSNADAEFTWVGSDDHYTGATAGTDRVFTLNANVGKVQIAYLNGGSINSYSTGTAYTMVRTVGAGNPAAHIRDVATNTTWAAGRYERTNGTITDYTGGELFTKGSVDTGSLAPGASSPEFTMTNVYGAKIGDNVEMGFSVDLKGLQIVARVNADNTITGYFHNPAGNPNGTPVVGFGTASARFYSKAA